jgi:hypothetical protein
MHQVPQLLQNENKQRFETVRKQLAQNRQVEYELCLLEGSSHQTCSKQATGFEFVEYFDTREC